MRAIQRMLSAGIGSETSRVISFQSVESSFTRGSSVFLPFTYVRRPSASTLGCAVTAMNCSSFPEPSPLSQKTSFPAAPSDQRLLGNRVVNPTVKARKAHTQFSARPGPPTDGRYRRQNQARRHPAGGTNSYRQGSRAGAFIATFTSMGPASDGRSVELILPVTWNGGVNVPMSCAVRASLNSFP